MFTAFTVKKNKERGHLVYYKSYSLSLSLSLSSILFSVNYYLTISSLSLETIVNKYMNIYRYILVDLGEHFSSQSHKAHLYSQFIRYIFRIQIRNVNKQNLV